MSEEPIYGPSPITPELYCEWKRMFEGLEKLIGRRFSVVKSGSVEVEFLMKFNEGEDGFEDVTFLVSNETDPIKACERVLQFVQMLVREVEPESGEIVRCSTTD